MIDFREYKDVIRSAVKSADERDENWKWRVEAVNKGEVRIGWGYMSYLGESGSFSVSEVPDGDGYDEIFIVGKAPNDAFEVCVIVGDDRWSDARSVADGIEVAIRRMAAEAGRRY